MSRFKEQNTMTPLYSNATVLWTEREIEERDALIRTLKATLQEAWMPVNRAIRFVRVETPILTPTSVLQGHIDVGFELLETSRGYLRPETTAGTIAAFHSMWPQAPERRKQMPICVWQAGKSFRDEKNGDAMRATKLRLREFWQLEFQLFAAQDTKANYLLYAANALQRRWGGTFDQAADLPHYSRATLDWHIEGLEVAGLSERTDWPDGIIYEVAIGLDRLMALDTREGKAE
jgi:tRNA synthetase class II core domain (G, H, P, S and T)